MDEDKAPRSGRRQQICIFLNNRTSLTKYIILNSEVTINNKKFKFFPTLNMNMNRIVRYNNAKSYIFQ